jgi:hypothetical protein
MTRVYETSINRREWRSIYHPNYPIGILGDGINCGLAKHPESIQMARRNKE